MMRVHSSHPSPDNRRRSRGTILGLVLFCLATELTQAQERRPNFLLIFTDDVGFGDLGSYGNPYAVTPNLDRLAAQGTSFRQFHVNGNICPVTRAGLMTGRNPSWFPNYTDDYSFLGAPTVCNVLQDAGYVTGHIGKWNIGPDYNAEYAAYGIDDLRITGSISDDPRGKEGLRFDVTIDFMEQYKDQPWYLNLWVYATHTPIVPSPELIARLDGVTIDRNRFGVHMQEKFDFVEANGGDIQQYMKIYLAEVMGMDIQVGRLLDKLDELGLAEDTVVVFSSDNGPERQMSDRLEALGSSGDLRGGKHSYYEGGTRVPFIVRWPGHVPAGRVDDKSIMFGVDWLTTVASIAGAPYDPSLFEGEDMSDVWLGNSRSRRNPLFFRRLRKMSKVYMRYGRWKLFKDEKELYDILTDMGEFYNLYNERPDIVQKMLVSLQSWEKTLPTVHARLPDAPYAFDPTQPVASVIIPDLPDAFDGFASPDSTVAPVVKATFPPIPPPTKPPTLQPTAVPVTLSPAGSPVARTSFPVVTLTRAPVAAFAPTAVATTAPTAAATVAPTLVATNAPIIAATNIPTSFRSPSVEDTSVNDGMFTGPIALQSQVLIRISPVSGDPVATLDVASGFESACSRFFRMHIPGTIVNVNCIIVKQHLISTGRRRHLQGQRDLQTVMVLDSTVEVSGVAITQAFDQEYFDATVLPVVNDYPDDFISSLRMWGDMDNSHFYFINVDLVEAYDPNGEIPAVGPSNPLPPDSAPTQDDGVIIGGTAEVENDGLSAGAVIGIVIACVVLFGAIVAALAVLYKRPTKGTDSPLASRGFY